MEDLRLLTDVESAVLRRLLAEEFTGVEALCAQAASVLARKGCGCGCGTIDLVPQDCRAVGSDAPSPVPVEACVLDDTGEPIGGVVLFLKNGRLSSLEVYGYSESPLPIPDPAQLVWE